MEMYDAVIIGSGPAGYECARYIAERKGKVAVIEKNGLGGTCTNSGCIPTKALHASAAFFSGTCFISAFTPISWKAKSKALAMTL